MARAFILVMDSFGIGATPDAERFGDQGADTLGHIAEHVLAAQGRALAVPALERLGLGAAAHDATGHWPAGFSRRDGFIGYHAAARELSRGKDTPSGHWEMAGVPVLTDWGYFPDTVPSFPADLTEALVTKAGLPGVLGNCHASGTEIITRLGDEHVATGKPIVYTSADSVFQIAAHEESFGLDRLYEVCRIAFELVAPYTIGRVIARPFSGSSGTYARTYNRRDLAVRPPAPTLLDIAQQAGSETIAIGKIGDIFAHQGVSKLLKANGNMALFDTLMTCTGSTPDASLVFANFVDFDQSYGHRRDIAGYAAALEAFDTRLPEFLAALQPGDLAVITADHGCDPSFRGTEHTREHVPVLCFGPAAPQGSGGIRDSFADIGQTVARHLGLPALAAGIPLYAP
jgi:phosphopentomutase